MAEESYDDGMSPTAARRRSFTLNAAGVEKVVSIYALMRGHGPGRPDAADRAGFRQLATMLNNFVDTAQPGHELGGIAPYDPALYRAMLFDKDWASPRASR